MAISGRRAIPKSLRGSCASRGSTGSSSQGVVFRDVPVLVSDIVPFRGQKRGLLGTAVLKRFNGTIDVRAGRMDLTARPGDLLEARIDRSRVELQVRLYVFDRGFLDSSLWLRHPDNCGQKHTLGNSG